MNGLLDVRDLVCKFPAQGGGHPFKAVDHVSFSLAAGRTLGLVGESGCGKTTLARAILRLIEPASGEIFLAGAPVTGISAQTLRARRRDMQIVFQNPDTALSPRRTIAQTLVEPLALHRIGSRTGRLERARELLLRVGLDASALDRYPIEFSAGQRQRIAIARALALDPKVLILDEAVSALDMALRRQILDLLKDIQRDLRVAYLFISHDLATVAGISDEVAVMYLGRLVERGPAQEVFRSPKHPYTRALLDAVPVPDPERPRHRVGLSGEPPSADHPPPGCPFHPRCPEVMPVCREVAPNEWDLNAPHSPHRVRCHLYDR